MITKYYKCKLLTDVVINASLATEGNLKTLDYIPGSNFLGIVATKYKEFSKQEAYDIFHSGKVSFGDAHIAMDDCPSYAMPYVLFQDKLNKGMVEQRAWVNPEVNSKETDVRWEQHRGGYFDPKSNYLKEVERKFSLKSAYDRAKRRAKDEAMFGFESLSKGQSFIFSIIFENDKYEKDITTILTKGIKRIGKSKTAQYGQVKIEAIDSPAIFVNGFAVSGRLTIYVESNICLLNECKQATFQPSAADFSIEGFINWPLSKIRTYSYSPWNAYRNTTGTQRDCILKGSVIVFDLNKVINDINSLPSRVGEYQEEGLGRVIYNPHFLDFDENGLWKVKLKKYNKEAKDSRRIPASTSLAKFLIKQKDKAVKELKIGEAVQKFLSQHISDFVGNVSASQWGVIRTAAIKAQDLETLKSKLFSDQAGILVSGVSAEMYWNKNNGKFRKILKDRMEEEDMLSLGTKFVAKLAAEMAKETQKNEKHEVHA